jgi:phosphopantetheinyl transferase
MPIPARSGSVRSTGKPSLAGTAVRDLRFNVSHSHGLALVAVTRARRSVDVELAAEVAQRADCGRFFASEAAVTLASEDRQAAALGLDRKEAIKARG